MLEKKTIVKSIEVIPSVNGINVKWENQILEDGNIISTQNHRKAYASGMREEFDIEVEGSFNYVDLIDWTVTNG